MTYHVTAYYEPEDDELDLTADTLANRLRVWGFHAVDVEED